MVIRNRYYAYSIWDDFRRLFGIKTGEELSQEWRDKNPNPPKSGITQEEIDKYENLSDEEKAKLDNLPGSEATAEPLEWANPVGVAIDREQAEAGGNTDCGHECGSFFSPIEWGCYIDKMVGGCGGSTGLCDAFGAGEACTKYAKYVLAGLGVGAVIIVVKKLRK